MNFVPLCHTLLGHPILLYTGIELIYVLRQFHPNNSRHAYGFFVFTSRYFWTRIVFMTMLTTSVHSEADQYDISHSNTRQKYNDCLNTFG